MKNYFLTLCIINIFLISSCKTEPNSLLIEIDSVFVNSKYIEQDTITIGIYLFYKFQNESIDTLLIHNTQKNNSFFITKTLDTLYFNQLVNCINCDTIKLKPKSSITIPFMINSNCLNEKLSYSNLIKKFNDLNNNRLYFKLNITSPSTPFVKVQSVLISKSKNYYLRYRKKEETIWEGL